MFGDATIVLCERRTLIGGLVLVAIGYHLVQMENNRSSKHTLAIGLALATILDTAGQLLWKFCVANLPQNSGLWQTADAVFRQPLFLILATIFLCQLINWMKVLERADLSFAQPVTSLSYVTVCFLSAILFGENIGPAKMAGVICVLVGVWLISQSQHAQHPRPIEP
jgi:drug/metabolite transporter (DMT)-like permease